MNKINTKNVMWIIAIVQFLMGIGSLMTGQATAESSWGKANILQMSHDKFYEQGYGFAFISIGILALGIAMYTSGKAQAKLTLMYALGTIVFLGGFWIMAASNEETYTIGVAYWLPGVVLTVLAGIAGQQGLKSAE
jgi:peptidoglycan/LPS O-acetylase OafA/YrhL